MWFKTGVQMVFTVHRRCYNEDLPTRAKEVHQHELLWDPVCPLISNLPGAPRRSVPIMQIEPNLAALKTDSVSLVPYRKYLIRVASPAEWRAFPVKRLVYHVK